MKVSFLMAYRYLTKNKATSFLLFINIFFATVLLDVVIIGGNSLEASISVSENSFIAPLVNAASVVFSIVIAFVSCIFLQNGLLISIEKRMKTLSQFCSIGCSKKLLKKCIVLEMGILTGIAIPIALVFCHIGMKMVFSYLNSYNAISQSIGNLKPQYSIKTLAALIIYVIMILLFSSFKSLKKVSQTSPIISVRQSCNFSKKYTHKQLFPKRSIPSQLAKRNLKMYTRRYWVISIGIACSLVLIYASNAFSNGINMVYSKKSKPFDYRVVLWGDSGVQPTNILNECSNLDKNIENTQVEELNYSLYNPNDDSVMNVKIMVLEDELFLDWYGKELDVFNNTIPCVQATSISAHSIQPDFSFSGMNYSIVGTNDKNTPFNIGNMEINENTVVLFTYQSIFNSVFNSNNDRMFSIYYDVEDGRLLNDKLEQFLSTAGIRYLIQDYTDTSAWYLQREALKILLKTVSVCFPTLVFLIFITEMLTALVSGILIRKKEIALFQCVGLSRKTVIKMFIYESYYYIKNGVLIGVPVGMIVSYIIAKKLQIQLFGALPIHIILLPIIILVVVLIISIALIKILTNPISLTDELNIDY